MAPSSPKSPSSSSTTMPFNTNASSNSKNNNNNNYSQQSSSASISASSTTNPVCSVLNVVIDHVMVPPTTLEPMEFRQQQQQQQQEEKYHQRKESQEEERLKEALEGTTAGGKGGGATVSTTSSPASRPPCLVPVLRVFGPIVRRDHDEITVPRPDRRHRDRTTQTPTLQSACLYIHGAYPYILARPRVAGPDGSLHPFRSAQEDARHIDWDDPYAVERIVPILRQALEHSIATSSSFGNPTGNTNNQHQDGKENTTANNKGQPTKAAATIRCITVVLGRGFYSYCPGPPAPFLRIEYYNPSERWKVKRSLEQGLDVDALYHPDPIQYTTATGQGPVRLDDSGQGLLRFNCYEAHIPYTMQVFKDYNLSGLSYIHVRNPRFRSLPKRQRRETNNNEDDEEGEKDDIVANNDESNHDTMFLEFNASQYLWPATPVSSSPPLPRPNAQANIRTSPAASHEGHSIDTIHQPVQLKMDAEIDDRGLWHTPPARETTCDVELDVHARDILNILDVITEQQADGVHWRAVPSLRELWSEERQRMESLLPRTEENDAFTLSVKNPTSAQPGTALAVQGMMRLFGSSEDFVAEDYERVVKQIIERHASAIDNVDAALRQPPKRHLASPPTSTPKSSQPLLTPDFSYAIDALYDLGKNTVKNPENDAKEEAKSSALKSPKEVDLSQSLRRESSQRVRFEDATQTYYNSSRPKPTASDLELSQRIERGEAVVDGPFRHVEDFIDPSTLLPYDILEDEGSAGEENDSDDDEQQRIEHEQQRIEHMEVELGTLASQSCEGQEDESTEENPGNEITAPLHSAHDGVLLESDAGEEESILALADSSDEEEDTTSISPLEGKKVATPLVVHGKERKPPQRKMLGDVDLLPLPQRNQLPSWLRHTRAYMSQRRLQGHDSWLPEVGEEGIFVRLTRSPPTARQVLDSLKKVNKKRNGSILQNAPFQKKAKNTAKESAKQSGLATSLTIDGSSRKLVATALDNINRQEIEEVQWQMTQQDTQEEVMPSQSPGGPSEVQPQNEIQNSQRMKGSSASELSVKAPSDLVEGTQESGTSGGNQALHGIGNQGGRLWVEGGGTLKAKTRHSMGGNENMTQQDKPDSHRRRTLTTPVTLMTLETHVQCRFGRAGQNDSKQIAMVPNSDRDSIFAIVYVHAIDPGGGEKLKILERGCIFVPVEREMTELNSGDKSLSLANLADSVKAAMPHHSLGMTAPLSVDCVEDERKLLLCVSAIISAKNPDMLLSWDPQGSGLGYIVERGLFLGDAQGEAISPDNSHIDMARLMGRLRPEIDSSRKVEPLKTGEDRQKELKDRWKGSGLGKDWDERAGPGVAAASIEGRLVFSTWKLVAEEVKHANASYLQAVFSSVLNQRIPFHDNLRLTQWYGHNRGRERWRVLHHKLTEATAGLLLIDALDIIGRAGESARLSGVEFSQSFPGIRGSQYKVEGVILRALKSLNSFERGSKKGAEFRTSSSTEPHMSEATKSLTESPWKMRRAAQIRGDGDTKPFHDLSDRAYFFFSPSLDDTNRQEALEVQALTLEPESGHIEDPVVVCDFTALYPSLIIAYNLCFSTCAGCLEYHSTRGAMSMQGKTTGKVGPMTYSEDKSATVLKQHLKSNESQTLEKNRMYVSPSRSMFVAESVVKGVLPSVLDEMLSTRAMLKKAAKHYKKYVPDLSPAVLRQLEARQLALKYVANVTYGYTSATFSGRCSMPVLADTIVECARRTLKNAIDLANSWGMDEKGKWFGCRCVYGDTDSVFIRLPGRTVKEAFRFGEEFCKAVTKMNPPPVQLKLEKVYLGCILQTKKKYCGMKFESKDDNKPIFEAKGLETIRRDQCALTQKVLKNSLIALFTRGIEAVKAYLFRQWSLILSRCLPVSDFILTGRVRSRYRGDSVGPVQAVLARRLAESDPGRVVRHKQRVAYVIVASPGVKFKLRDGVLSPMELLEQWDAYVLNTAYYITKHVNPSLDRCLSLAPHRVDVASWYASCPKPRRRTHFWPATIVGSNATLPRFFGSSICGLCGGHGEIQGNLKVALCSDCKSDIVPSLLSSLGRLNAIQSEMSQVAAKCTKCSLTYEDASTFAVIRSMRGSSNNNNNALPSGVATPLGNCTCIDCPLTFKRHRLREAELEALELCTALGAGTEENF